MVMFEDGIETCLMRLKKLIINNRNNLVNYDWYYKTDVYLFVFSQVAR